MKAYLEIRFYVCLAIATSLIYVSLYIPPEGQIDKSVLYITGFILIIGALCVGLDIKGIIHEIGEIISEGHRFAENLAKAKETGNESAA